MDPKNIEEIEGWEDSRTMHEVRIFMGIENYYHNFIANYSKTLAPLSDLFKKDRTWIWSKNCQVGLCEPKSGLVIAPVLRLPYFENLFGM